MSDINRNWKQKTEAKNIENSLSYGRKTIFSAILKNAAILKTRNNTSPNF
jgi:hypothetical protein